MTRRALFFLTVALVLAPSAHANPFNWLRKLSLSPTGSDVSWLLGWGWGTDSTISVVDRSPPLTFPARPAAFGAYASEPLMGYVIPLAAFTQPCVEPHAHTNGSEWDTEGRGHVRHVKENLGCPRLCIFGDKAPDSTESWIALVQRGQCQFVEKAREAQRLGAKGVVVGGDHRSVSGNPDTLINMFSPGDSSDLDIVATFIKYSDYMELSALIAASNTSHNGIRTLSLLVFPSCSSWEWYSPILTFLILLLLPSSLTLLTLLVHRVRAVRQAQRERAPEDVVHSLPWRVWTGTGWEKHEGAAVAPDPDIDLERGPAETTTDAATELSLRNIGQPSTSNPLPAVQHPAWFDNQHECAICLGEFEKGDRVRVLPCNHIFHLTEVDEWLIQRKKLCPVCKADVTQPPPSFPLADTEDSPDDVPPPSDAAPVSPHTSQPPSRAPSPATERTPLLRDHDSSS